MSDQDASQEVRIIPFAPEYAEQVPELFRAVYGEEYPIKTYYDPALLMKAMENRELFQSLAVTPQGRVVGVGNMYLSAPYKNIFEAGAGLVHPDFRKLNLFNKMYCYLYEEVATKNGLDLVFGEDVCNHIWTQKMSCSHQFLTAALEVDLMPASTYKKEKASTGRVSCHFSTRTYVSHPHRVYLPAPYRDQLSAIYQWLDDTRDQAVSMEALPDDVKSRIKSAHFGFAKVSRMTVEEIGPDFGSELDRAEEEARSTGSVVSQAHLHLGCPWVGRAVEILRRRGYFLGGVLPRWFDSDGMLMQKITGRPNWEGINLHMDSAKRLLEMVEADWRSVTKA